MLKMILAVVIGCALWTLLDALFAVAWKLLHPYD